MIRRFWKLISEEWQGMHQAAILLGVFSLVSQLIGLVRDRMLASRLGPSPELDVYYAAFRIPDLIYLSIASLASITVLMPFLIERLDTQGKEAARRFMSDVFSGFLLLLVVACSLIFALMPRLAHLIAPGFSQPELHQLVVVSRVMLLSPIFLGLSNMLGTVTQLLRKFFIFSLSPIFYNAGIIFGILFLYPHFGLYGLAAGVAFGALLHLIVQIPTIVTAGFTPKLSSRLQSSTLRQVSTLSLPRTLGLSMNSIALLVIVALGSTLGTGAISIFNFSLNLETTPVGIIGISYAVASFPLLAETFSRGKLDEWRECVLSAIRQIVFWSLPITALLIVLRAQIVRIVLGSGNFSWSDTRLTAACLALFAIGLVAQNMILVSVRAFYSAHNTKTPLYINMLSSVLIVLFAIALIYVFKHVPMFRYFIEALFRVEDTPGTSVLMLPLAYSLGTSLNAYLHFIDLKKKYLKNTGTLSRTIFESLAASFAMGLVSYLCLNLLANVFSLHTFFGVLMQGGLACLLGVAAGVAVLWGLHSEPFFNVLAALRRKFWKVDLNTSKTLEGA